MPRTESQYAQIREKKKKLIMDTALQLFAGEGYHNTAISTIARKAGIAKGLLYNYFKSKDELLNALIKTGTDDFMELFNPDREGIPTDEEMIHLIDATFMLVKKNLQYWKLYFAMLLQPFVMDKMRETVARLYPRYVQLMSAYFQKKGSTDPETESLVFGMLLDGLTVNYLISPEHFPAEKIKRIIIRKYLNIKHF